MAQSRLEKVGTIYSRTASLIKAKAVPKENKPMWLDIYKSFPPKHEPRYDRPGSSAPLRHIFYAEDELRARFHQEHRNLSANNLLDKNYISRSEHFLAVYKKLEAEGIPETERYDKAIEEIQSQLLQERSQRDSMFLDSARSRSQLRKPPGVNKERSFQNQETNLEEDKEKYKPIKLSVEKLFTEK